MTQFFENKNILVTGGAGSVGKELIRYLLKYKKPAVVRIFDTNEAEMFNFQSELAEKNYIHNVRFLIGDVRDKDRLIRALNGIDYVFHTAAYKHVLSSEYNPFETVKTNVIGVQNIIEASLETNVKKVIFTSSDKAVNPSSTMGATKLLGEKLMVSANYYGGKKTAFSSVRFGNVMDSSGSVIPIFKRQINEGRFITITDPEMTRFMMAMSQAVKLLVLTMEISQGGEAFILKMPTVKISDLAEVLIDELAARYGHRPESIGTKIIGTKLGEKLYEELMTDDEATRSLERDDMFIILPNIKDELIMIDETAYNASPITSTEYISRDVEPITKDEIKSILIKENII
ncbi:polysaccharide biosynthesis protein [Methanolobus psychrotolerans]|uniref:polysaccharide biosynthesis protein n=1 Tax=Methanolobus psychrotolerans TaxID=1874706 RepID=UPI000B9192E1|nr:polysaccharide biosynthesis protein [Methanolobus psychrotolerans]